jgi:hypothetical protein
MKQFIIALALATLFAFHSVAEEAILRSLPSDVQKEIERVRQSCRELGPVTSDYTPPRVTEGDEGLITFTVSDVQAVLVDEVQFCGSGFDCFHAINCATGFTHRVAIYIRTGESWTNSLSTFASEPVLLSVEYGTGKFKALVLKVFPGDWGCPVRTDAGTGPDSFTSYYEGRISCGLSSATPSCTLVRI